MTQADIHNEKEAIRIKYDSLGGKPEMFEQFFAVLVQSNDFGLNESWVVTPLDLAGQWFTPKFTGEVEKMSIADYRASAAEKRGDLHKKYNYFTKQYE